MRRALVAVLFPLLMLAGLAAPAVAAPRAANSTPLPTVHGGYGSMPTLTFPSAAAPKNLVVKVLTRGKGPAVKSGDAVAVNYFGQIWRGKVFDSSFSRRQLFGFVTGAHQVITGWDKGIAGVHVGSRVLLVIPPADGYGSSGQPSVGITGTSTLVFVVDVVGAYSKNAGGDAHATGVRPTVDGIAIGGKLGGRPTVTIEKGAPQPKSLQAAVVARGAGPKVKAGLIFFQFVAAQWPNKQVASTWGSAADEQTIGDPQNPTYFDPLIGVPVGSRVLLEVPKTSSGGPYALVVDILAEPADPQKG